MVACQRQTPRFAGKLRDTIGEVKRRLLLVLGLVAVLPLVAVDPALAFLLLDAELLTLLGGVGLTMTAADVRLGVSRLARAVATSLPVLELRAGWRLTREQPRSLLAA